MLTRSCTWHGSLQRNETEKLGDVGCGVECLRPKCRKPEAGRRKVTTLSRHYYPEGGWGWVIVCVSVAVHTLNHGVQLAWPVAVTSTALKFRSGWLETVKGKSSSKYVGELNA
ncbi:hypothetical protein J6590_030315 [Homalodisca vitripennis]|nr:hypothetical protein J6590_030315 [Homalodisca vitripennis]